VGGAWHTIGDTEDGDRRGAGLGSASNRLLFPRLGSGNTDKWLIYEGLACRGTTATATVKIRIEDSSDSAGILLGWTDQNNFLRAEVNSFWRNV
jgi:hypothetical protein